MPAARVLVAGAGAQGVYLGNFLSGQATIGDGGEVLAFWGHEQLLGMAFFGERGNLITIEAQPLDGDAVAAALAASLWSWRIVLGPPAVVMALARREPRPPLVHRRQLYYGMQPAAANAIVATADLRCAQRRDERALLEAALELNQVDLHIDRHRVHKAWLREAIRRRTRLGQTLVVGAVGDPQAKLDIGSQGPCGLVLEGVYTVPAARGRGLASGLVAATARQHGSAPLVCLHVAADNRSARSAYARAGMTVLGECELLLRH